MLATMCVRKYKADIEAYISKLITKEATTRHPSSLPRLPWQVWLKLCYFRLFGM